MSSSHQHDGGPPASDVFSRPPPERSNNSNTIDHPLSEVNVELSERSRSSSIPQPPPPPPPSSAPFSPTNPAPSFGIPPPPPLQQSTATATSPAVAKTLDDLADAFLSGPSPRTVERGLPPILAPDPLPAEASDLERLKILVQRRAWADVLLYTNQLKTGPSSHYAPLYEALVGYNNNTPATAELALETHLQDLVYILTVHVTALVKVGNIKELAQEVKRWTFCHHHHHRKDNNNNHRGTAAPTWIPWSLHIVAATTLQFGTGQQGNSKNNDTTTATQTCLDALWAIRSDIPVDQTASVWQVENALHNVFIAQKDWRMALDCLQRMIENCTPAATKGEATRLVQLQHNKMYSSEAETVARTLAAAHRSEFLSRQGRILLQAGALDQASVIFQQAGSAWKELHDDERDDEVWTHHHGSVQLIPAQLAVNEGLLKFSYGKYEEALEFFHTAVQHLRRCRSSSPLKQHPSGDNWAANAFVDHNSFESLSNRSNLYSETINNMALCALYTCRLQQALQLMESLVREDVAAHLTDRVALNLCTLYELASDSAASARKKRVLQLIARRFFLHDIGPESFRVS
jgi:tetratricopeptide (TPR) repeat protein